MKKKLLVLALLFGLSACNVSNQSTTPTENNEQTTPSEVENNNVVKYTITFASNGGTGSMDSVQVEEGADFTLPLSEFTVPEGQEFIGWRVNGEGDILVPGAKIKVNGNIILVAQWRVVETNNNGGENTNEPEPTEQEPTEPEQKVEYTISFSSNGGTGSMDQEEAEENTNFTLPSNGFTSPKDHDFIGWKINDEGDLLQPGASITITGNIILVAQWQENISNISVRNVYFGDYSGGDAYLEEIEKKFDVKLNISSYDYSNWEQQVIGSINGGSLSDVFHANISSANFGSTYKRWAEEEIIKPLPDDLSKWPNIKSLIEHTSNVNYLKIDGKLYGIPVSRNVVDYSKTFSSYTYIYRRDWAKQWSVYQENDIYTWEQFQNLLATFKAHLENGSCPLADAEWGYPSVANFYKTAPGCYAQNTEGHYVNNYFTNEYIEGLNVAKTFLNNGWSHPDQYSFSDGQASTAYRSNRVGVFYENLSYTNYVSLRK